MELEGIDVTVLFPPGSGEEWALGDAGFAAALCRTLNDARAEYASHAPDRIKVLAKLPMIEPKLAAEELERCVTQHGFVGMVTATHLREKNLDDPCFDIRITSYNVCYTKLLRAGGSGSARPFPLPAQPHRRGQRRRPPQAPDHGSRGRGGRHHPDEAVLRDAALELLGGQLRLDHRELRQHLDAIRVITSYSIHYTKLYEARSRRRTR